jgi:hypothetical protein
VPTANGTKKSMARKKEPLIPINRQNQIDAHKRWRELHPEYWREYRKGKKARHSHLIRPLQRGRVACNFTILPGKYFLVPIDGQNVNMTRSRLFFSLLQPL